MLFIITHLLFLLFGLQFIAARDDKLSSASLILLKVHILIVRFRVSEANRESDNVFEKRRPRKTTKKRGRNREAGTEIELREKCFKNIKNG